VYGILVACCPQVQACSKLFSFYVLDEQVHDMNEPALMDPAITSVRKTAGYIILIPMTSGIEKISGCWLNIFSAGRSVNQQNILSADLHKIWCRNNCH